MIRAEYKLENCRSFPKLAYLLAPNAKDGCDFLHYLNPGPRNTFKSCGEILYVGPSLNTQSCIKGLLLVRDFRFWAAWAAGPVHKKKLGADYEQLLRAVFSCFGGQNTIVSALKSCIINLERRRKKFLE